VSLSYPWSKALKLALISDIHSNLDAFEAVISRLPSYDCLLCLGDVVGYGPQPNQVVEKLRALRPEVTLMGNHDHAVTTGDTSGFSPHAAQAVEWTRRHITQENARYLSGLMLSSRMELSGKSVVLFHGSPRDPLTEYVFPTLSQPEARQLIRNAEAHVVLLGHTHVPMVYVFQNEMLANPGSVGQPRDGDPRASFAILTISDHKISFSVERVDYDVGSVANKILRAGLPRFLADRLCTGM
jgi:putative phosphoesterase